MSFTQPVVAAKMHGEVMSAGICADPCSKLHRTTIDCGLFRCIPNNEMDDSTLLKRSFDKQRIIDLLH
jgi:hypothetical protein